MKQVTNFFEKFARGIALYSGRPVTFFIAFMIVVIWAFTGPIFNFSDTWQLVINTGTTIITFLMVFLVQSAQNRDSKALQLKFDELILKLRPADNMMIDIQDLTEKELDELAKKYKRVRLRHQKVNGRPKSKKSNEKMNAEIDAINLISSEKKQVKAKKPKKTESEPEIT